MSIRVSASLLLLIALVLSLSVGAAQDPTAPTAATPQAPDLSGTYTGTFNCEAAGLVGETTLTITGNQFTTADGKTGRIVASRSGGYTAVAFQVGEVMTTPGTTGAAATPPQIFSMRARKVGNRLIMTPAPGTAMKCSFTPGRTARGRRTPPATATEVATPTTSPSPTITPETPVPEQTPSPSPTATPSPIPSPSPEPSPEPNPSPAPSPSPDPTPDPGPSPSPMPSPTATPSPTPSPSPRRA